MLTLAEVKEHVKDAFNKAGYNLDDYNIDISFNGRLTKTLGLCRFRSEQGKPVPYAIEISKQLNETATDDCIKGVIYHEAAHALVTIETKEDHKHDNWFKSMCYRIGAPEVSGYSTKVERIVDEATLYKYFIRCRECGEIVGKYTRMGKVIKNIDIYRCNHCHGMLEVIQNF